MRGFRRLDKARGIEWRLFFHPDLEAGAPLAGAALVENNDDASKRHRTQLAYKIDTMLVAPLGALPPAVAADPANLAARTLRRGKLFHLPSGQKLASLLGIPVLPEDRLSVRNKDKFNDRVALHKINPDFVNNAPLWFYILAELEQGVINAFENNRNVDLKANGTRLTGVGAAIVVETFVGLMLSDPDSVLGPAGRDFVSINGNLVFSMRELLADIGGFP